MIKEPDKRKWEHQWMPRIDAAPGQIAKAIATPLKPPGPSLRKTKRPRKL